MIPKAQHPWEYVKTPSIIESHQIKEGIPLNIKKKKKGERNKQTYSFLSDFIQESRKKKTLFTYNIKFMFIWR